VVTAKAKIGEAAGNAGLCNVAVAGIKQATNTALSAPVIAAWTLADVVAGPALDHVGQKLKDVSHVIDIE
jgi:hypothetical protein